MPVRGLYLRFYSVAEHSLLIALWLRDEGYDPDVQMAGLLHDAAEAYTGDIIWPMQKLLWEAGPRAREAYNTVQRRLNAVIAAKAGIDPDLFHSDAVASPDLRILLDERVALHDAIARGWDLAEDIEPLGVRLHCWEPSIAGLRWLAHYRQLEDVLS